jgi:hypothetical protein
MWLPLTSPTISFLHYRRKERLEPCLILQAQRVQINNTDTTINSEFHSSSQLLLLHYSDLRHLQHTPRHHRSHQSTSSNRSHPARSPRTRRRRRAPTRRRRCRTTLHIRNRDARHARAIFALVVCEELSICFEFDVCALFVSRQSQH